MGLRIIILYSVYKAPPAPSPQPYSPVKLASNLRKIGKIASFKNPTDLDAKKHALLEITFFTIISVCVNIIFYT